MATVKAKENEVKEIVFHVNNDKCEKVQCFGNENETLKEAIEKSSVLSNPINEYIFRANVKGHSEQVVVNQNLLCRWLEKDTEIKTHKLSPSDLEKLSKPQEETKETSYVSNQTLFFINNDRGKYGRKITRISYEKLQAKHICVSAVKGDTLRQALVKVGCFKNLEDWELTDSNKRSKVALERVAKLCENTIFDVTVCSKKRNSSPVGSENDSNAHIPVKKEKLEKVESNYCSSTTPMSAKQTPPVNSFRQQVLASLSTESRNLEQLLGGEGFQELATLYEEHFSKVIDSSKSVQFMQKLVSASKSVGHIYAEGCCTTGTCFYWTKDVILTNYHVIEKIKKDMISCQGNPKVNVSFNYEQPNQRKGLREVEVDIGDILAQSQTEKCDYIFLRLKAPYRKKLPAKLQNKISAASPDDFADELVTVIGHPDGREKQIDFDCRVISKHTWRPELLDRIQKRQSFEFNPEYLECKETIMNDYYEHKMAYDTSFFHGASGSPVFDKDVQVIAMHTLGWVLDVAGTNNSVMEFAIPMQVIYNDCYKNYPTVANTLFPSFSTPTPMNLD